MTETMLEKATRAIWRQFYKPGDPTFDELGPAGAARLEGLARATLLAIREPSDAVADSAAPLIDHYDRDFDDPKERARLVFEDMIDAILAEKPEDRA